MYASYTYAAGSTKANVQADIGAIITGETNKANLSAACVQENTEIITTLVAGWTLWDAAAGTDAKVYRAQLADDPTKFKYLRLGFATANALLATGYETWDNVAHTGSSMCNNSDVTTTNQRIDLSAGGSMMIFATARFCVFASNVAAGYGSVNYGGPSGLVERTRAIPFDTVAEGCPPWGFVIFGYPTYGASLMSWSAPRIMDNSGGYVSGSAARGYVHAPTVVTWWTTALTGIAQLVPSGAGTTLLPFLPGYFVNTALMSAPYGEFSSLCDIWKLPSGVHSHMQTIQKGGINYLVVKQCKDSVEMMCFRKS